jgi:hypothetical protein
LLTKRLTKTFTRRPVPFLPNWIQALDLCVRFWLFFSDFLLSRGGAGFGGGCPKSDQRPIISMYGEF